METKEITESNKIIAEFMDYEYLDDFNYPENNEIGWYNEDGNCIGIELNFHSSWDWIMPVVMKIEELGYEVNIKGIKCSVNCVLDENPIISYVLGEKSKKIELLFTVIVEFIKWYNENNKNN